MTRITSFLLLLSCMAFIQCDTVKNLPTNTTGGVFSLNGQWTLTESTDNKGMEGTVITVVPGFSQANVKTLPAVNAYCVREQDAMWRNVVSDKAGGFLADLLVNACTGGPVYKPATIAVLSNSQVRIKSVTHDNKELIQTYTRQ